MQFRRTGHTDDRRRRVLRDELLGGEGEAADADGSSAGARGSRVSNASRKGQRYSAAALADRQAPVTCLVPKRAWTLGVLFLGGLSILAGLETLYTNVYWPAPPEWQAVIPALDVNARGSLAAWLGSLLWTLSAAAAFLIYSIRRHRLDDYRGRYRLWLGVVLLCGIVSVDLTTGLHTALARQLTELTGTRPYGSESLWWILSAGAIGGLVAIRLIIEIRSCRLAVLALLLTVVAFAGAACVETRFVVLDEGFLTSMIRSSCLLAAHLFAAATVASYARYVYRDSQGELAPRRAKAESAKSPRAAKAATEQAKESRAARSVRVDAGHAAVGAKTSAGGPTLAVRGGDASGLDASSDTADANLSRSERRRLRKELRRQAKAG